MAIYSTFNKVFVLQSSHPLAIAGALCQLLAEPRRSSTGRRVHRDTFEYLRTGGLEDRGAGPYTPAEERVITEVLHNLCAGVDCVVVNSNLGLALFVKGRVG